MKLFVSMSVLLVVIMGCATTTVPIGCEKSLVYKIPNADALGSAGIVALTIGTQFKPDAKPYICNFANIVLQALKDDKLTYLDFATMITDHVKWINSYFGSSVLVFQAMFATFDKPVPLDPCDVSYLKRNMLALISGVGC